jgi:Helix-turn-helix domain
MAKTAPSAPNAFPSEIARYLAVDPDDVKRMIRLAGLPAIKIPKKTRSVHRIPLRDFHTWLKKRSSNPSPELDSYDQFLADFNTTRQTSIPDPANE